MYPQLPMYIWVYLQRDPEIKGWGALLLDLDLVTQGESLQNAIDMASDAAAIVLAETLKYGASRSSVHRAAPSEDWERLWALFKRGPALPIGTIMDREMEFSEMGTQLQISAVDILQRSIGQEGDHSAILSMPLGVVA